MTHWLGQYLNSDLAKAERSLQQTLERQNAEMSSLLLELASILGVPFAPAGINGAFRREDFIERATLLSKSSRKEGWERYDGMGPLEQREADGDR